MPIRVACSCGKQLAVKDEMAGKAVRCPACKQAVKVPAKRAKPASSARGAAPAPAADDGLSDLFDQEGIEGHAGPLCPACGGRLTAGSVLCTHCGMNLQTGERMMGHQEAQVKASVLGHEALDHAAQRMKEDQELQKRTMDAGMPWWFLLVMFIFIVIFSVGAVAIIDAAAAEREASGLAGMIKRYAADRNVVWGCVIAGVVLMAISRIWITSLAFLRSKAEGFLTLFVWFRFVGQLGNHPVLGLIYTLGFFTTLSGLGLFAADYFGGGG